MLRSARSEGNPEHTPEMVCYDTYQKITKLWKLQNLPERLLDISIPTWSWFLGCLMFGFLIAHEGSLTPKKPLESQSETTHHAQTL